MAPFRLICLGPPALHGPDGDPIRFRTRKHFALLIYLAVEPGLPHRRDRLATLLWPAAELDEARHSLATALSMLRGRLGSELLEADRDTVRLRPGQIATDLVMLERDGSSLEEDGPVGPFLEEFDIPDAVEFQQWKDSQHARLLPAVHSAVAQRIEHCRRRGDSRRMERLGHRLQRIDELSEEAVRAILEARAMAGDRIGALRAYDRWRERLADELGATPATPVQRMADRLRRGGCQRPALALLAPVPTEQWKERLFIGRGGEFGVLYDRWQRVQHGEPRHILLRGESGIGKTTLAERLATSSALEGASVARVQCYELERELPFGVAGSLVELLLDLPGANATPPDQLAELGRLSAKVRQRYPSLPTPIETIGESARILYTEAVMALVAAVAEEQPVVLVVDDIHMADATSLAVLHLILRRIESLSLLVVLTASSALESETPSTQRFVENASLLNLMVVPLGPLTTAESEELLGLLLAAGEDPGPAIRRAILAGACGNPMVLELLVDDWRRRADGCHALSVSAMTLRTERPPREAFQRLAQGTIDVLDAEARSVAQLAALLGKRLNDLTMYTLVDLPVARTMRAMTVLTSHRVLRDAGNHLEFANEFIRGQCYVGTAAPLRRMLHGQVAERLLLGDLGEDPIPGLEIAWHLVRADRLLEAIPYLLAGGRESIRRGAPHEADLALSTGLPELLGAPRRTAILLLAEARQELGQWSDSLQVLEAREPFTQSEESCRQVLRIGNQRWLGHLVGERLHEATEQLFAIAEQNEEVDIEVKAKALSASTLLISCSRTEQHIDRLGREARRLLSLKADDYVRIHLLHAAAWFEAQTTSPVNALPLLREGVELIRRTETASSIAARTLLGTGVTLCQGGEYEEAAPILREAYEYAKRLDNPGLTANAASGLALVTGRLGDAKSQIDWSRLAIRISRDTEWGICLLSAAYERGLGLCLDGRFAEAESSVDEVDNRFGNNRPEWLQQAWLLCKADVLELAGRNRRSHSAARRALSIGDGSVMHPCFVGQYARWLALVAHRDGWHLKALHELSDLEGRLYQYDKKDQAEILAAKGLLLVSLGIDSGETWREVRIRLDSLPESIGVVMRRLGLHFAEAPQEG